MQHDRHPPQPLSSTHTCCRAREHNYSFILFLGKVVEFSSVLALCNSIIYLKTSVYLSFKENLEIEFMRESIYIRLKIASRNS